MNAKHCVSCNKLIAESFAKCTYCGADQPAAAAGLPKEVRCGTCRRPFSSKLGTCPFCARGMSVPPLGQSGQPPATSQAPPLSSGGGGGGATPSPAAGAEDNHILGNAVLFGVPLAVGAVCGVVESMTTNRLGDGDFLGLSGLGWFSAFVLAALIAVGFARRYHGDLADALEELGLPKLAGQIAGVAAVAFFPAALTISGLLGWFNAMGAAEHEQDLSCTVTSAFRRMQKNAEGSWHIAFVCDGAGAGEKIVGSVDRETALGLGDGATFHVRASRGRLGTWLRASDLRTDAATASPTGPTATPRPSD